MQAKIDLAPYRPLPKFICVKSLVFFTFWQGLLIGLVMRIANVDDSVKHTAAQYIQDTLLCLEMPLFAWMHYYAFPCTDYEDARLSSRVLFPFAVRDALGVLDIVCDAKTTFANLFWTSNEYGFEEDEAIPILRSQQNYGHSQEVMADVRFEISKEEEEDYAQSRRLVFGDHQYPVFHSDFRNPPQVQNSVNRFTRRFYEQINSNNPPTLEWDE